MILLIMIYKIMSEIITIQKNHILIIISQEKIFDYINDFKNNNLIILI